MCANDGKQTYVVNKCELKEGIAARGEHSVARVRQPDNDNSF